MNVCGIEDIYPLSPMQEGMLFHTLMAEGAGIYVTQVRCAIRGELNVSALEQAWEQVIDRHPVLRTALIWERRDAPLQVVYRGVKLPLIRHDWRGLTTQEQQVRLQAFLRADRSQGFEFSQACLMRITLILLSNDSYELIWSHHHALLDGWSVSIVLREIFACYEALCRGEQAVLGQTRSYRDYIAWLQRQDKSQVESFWRELLKGFNAATRLAIGQNCGKLLGEAGEYGSEQIFVSEEMTWTLQRLSRQHQLTLSTFVQGPWGLLLSRYGGGEDIVFGTTVSGRSNALFGYESMVGLFINTLPTRVQIPVEARVLNWLGELQQREAEMRQYEWTPLVEIQRWSEVPRGVSLFESLFVFENYPVDASVVGRERAKSIEIRLGSTTQRTDYPLAAVSGLPGSRLLLRIDYARERFAAGT